jgi:hypothetical protein
MSSLRYRLAGSRLDRLAVQIGGPGASLRGQWPVLLVSLAAVFACFYALGSIVDRGSSARVVAPGALPAASVDAAIPHALSGGSPTAGAVPGAIAPAPAPSPARAGKPGQRAATLPQSTLTTVTETPAPTPVPQSSAAAPQSARTEATPPSRSSSGSPSSGQRAAGKGTPSGGVSFDSSE